MSFVKKSWTKINWRVGSHGPLNNLVVLVIIISFLVAPDFYRLECFKFVSVDIGIH
jgi:hypothetical protein